MSEQGPLARPVVSGQPSCGSLSMTVFEQGRTSASAIVARGGVIHNLAPPG
jgi:hypothetical protein